MRADLAYAARSLRRSPGYVAVAVATLALGIGANTAIFSLVNGVLLRPLPWPDPDRVVRIYATTAQDVREAHSGPDFLDLREQLRAFSVVAAWTPARFTIVDRQGPQGVDGASVSDGFFDVLGALPAEGRFFHDGDVARGAEPQAILSDATWRERFLSDPRVVGKVITLNRKPVTVIGVARADFVAPERHDIWVLDGDLPRPPFGAEVSAERGREVRYLLMIGRVRSDLGPAAAAGDLKRVARQLAVSHPDYNAQRSLRAVPLGEVVTAEVRPGLLMLSGAVGFLLLIACANVANLALARATTREKEMAVRRALGAGRTALVRLVAAEQFIVAGLGATLGVAGTLWGLDTLLAISPVALPRGDLVRVDVLVLVFAAALAAVTALVVGLVATVGRLDDRLDAALREGTRTSASRGRQRVRSALVVFEVALAMVLVAGAGLLGKSFARLQSKPAGFDPAGVLTVSLPLPLPQYAERDLQHAFYRDLQGRVARIPGITHAALAFPLPLSAGGHAYAGVDTMGGNERAATDRRRAGLSWITPGYFSTLRIPFVTGRDFSERDIEGRQRAAIVNLRMVQEFFGGRNPIGHEIRLGPGDADRMTVVGVVGDVRAHPEEGSQPEVYLPIHQHAFPFMTLLVRTQGNPRAAAPLVREVIRKLDPDLALGPVRPYTEVVDRAVAQPRFRTRLLTAFGGLALLLAALGIYGVMSYTVSQRVREFGVRLALGADRRDVWTLVVRQAALLTGAGLTVGLALAFALSRTLRSMLFEVAPHDPLTFTGVALSLAVVALAASAVPAWRATRIDPLAALRME